MLYVSCNIVHLDLTEEVARSYTQYRPAAKQFRVAGPYQQALATDTWAAGVGNVPQDGQGSPVADATAAMQGPNEPNTDSAHRRKRRRKGPCTDAVRLAREQEADQRHAAAEGFLSSAHALLQEHLRQHAGLECGPDAPEQPEAAAAKAAVPLDLLALAQLKRALRPKLQLLGAADTGAANLFEQVLENGADEEQLADACGATVLLPARCRFLISDVTRLGPLLEGMRHCRTCASMLVCDLLGRVSHLRCMRSLQEPLQRVSTASSWTHPGRMQALRAAASTPACRRGGC